MRENPINLDMSVMGFKDRQEKGYNDSGYIISIISWTCYSHSSLPDSKKNWARILFRRDYKRPERIIQYTISKTF